jgi:DNA-directed RNA polymerase
MGGVKFQEGSEASNIRLAQLVKADLSEVYEAVGYLDRTKYKINTRVLEVLKHHYKHSRGVGSLLSYEETPIPAYPKKAEKDRELHKKWCKDARNAHDKNALTRMAKLDTTRLIGMAEENAEHSGLYFPHQIDFRGRAYPMPICLNPQGPDHVRALLHFAEGKHVKNDKAMEWLMIHGANCWGYDKCPMLDRIAWVKKNSKLIADTYHDPYSNTEWHKADKPWSFLAWVYDFVDVIEHGKPSYVRVAMDGSCNGLQHFSAMTRDPVGAKAVNLANNEKPNDIYQTVADRVKVKLASVTHEQKWMADTWLALGIDRKLTKRSVMVMPYGGTRHSTMEYLDEALTDRLKGKANPFGEEKAKAVAFLATVVYDATREVVIGGKVVMEWLQEVAKVAADANVHLKWTTPHGMLVQQHYTKWVSRQIETYLNGRGSLRVSARMNEDTGVLNPKLSCNGISPNFVHSLDACALMRTVNLASKKGVTHFHMIHDDYGTHAADTQLLADTLRKAFVEMYSKHDVLTTFRNEVLAQLPIDVQKLVPKVPAKGKFNLKEVLKSEFFFA